MSNSRQRGSEPSIAIIGAGFGGIGMAARLKRSGFQRITILEQSNGIGGTWWLNTYPGVEVDTPSILYSYSYMYWNWSRTHVTGAELQEYIEAVADRYDIRKHVRLGVRVDRVEWDELRQEWVLYNEAQELLRANFVVSAVGLLSDPKYPSWPGLDSFTGPVIHTARWDHTIDLTGKRVAVVGTGSSGVQIIPELADVASELRVFQRDPGWIVPKHARDLDPAEREALHSQVAQRIGRLLLFAQRDVPLRRSALWRVGTKRHTAAENAARAFLESSLAGRADLSEAVTPKHPFGGKRPVSSDNFYPTLLHDHVVLVPRAVSAIEGSQIVDESGEMHPVDAIVLSTGFTTDFLSTVQVCGRGGLELHETWGNDVRAFLGMMVPQFPNFFMMYGPNTNGGTIVTALELQADYIASVISMTTRRARTAVEVAPESLERFDADVQRWLVGTTFEYEHNYFKTKSGRIATQWPVTVFHYARLTKFARRRHLIFESRVGAARGADAPAPRGQMRRFPWISGTFRALRVVTGMNIASVLIQKNRAR